ncbi:MAG: 30S ribosomal protein S6 [Patescibacteria group bacterium]
MQDYELTVVLPGSATAAKKKSVQEAIGKIIKTFNGKVGKVEDQGKKDLAYQIAKNDSGVFLFFPLELSQEGAKALPQKLNLEEDIIRYLLVRKEK